MCKQSKQCGTSKRVSGVSERVNDMNERVAQYLTGFLVILDHSVQGGIEEGEEGGSSLLWREVEKKRLTLGRRRQDK